MAALAKGCVELNMRSKVPQASNCRSTDAAGRKTGRRVDEWTDRQDGRQTGGQTNRQKVNR